MLSKHQHTTSCIKHNLDIYGKTVSLLTIPIDQVFYENDDGHSRQIIYDKPSSSDWISWTAWSIDRIVWLEVGITVGI